MKSYSPAEIFPPGEFLKDEIEARGWSQADLAEILGRPPRLVSEIIGGKRAISPETAQGLGDAFGVDPQYWLNLESAYQLSKVRAPDAGVAKRARLFEKAPIKELIRRHWIEPSDDAAELETNLLEFFGIDSLDKEPQIWAHAARKSSPYENVTPAQWAWLCRARRLAQFLEAAPYTKSHFAELLARLRALFASPEEARHVPRILAEYGIRLVVVEPLANTRIDGACFWLDPKSPVIVLSIRFDRIDAFWFTLLHELGHVKACDGLRNDAVPLDVDLFGQGAAKPESKPEPERRADEFATGAIISKAKLDSFIARIRPLYYKEKIRGFAVVNEVHPGLVVGQLQYRGEISYSHNREMLAKVRDLVIRVALTDGWGAAPAVY
jgi:HTH-type transcriptional regulator/antitoxin HigA